MMSFTNKSKFILIDFNGEYSKKYADEILTKEKKVYILKTKDNSGEKYPISKAEIEKLELLSILLNATEKTQQPFLRRALGSGVFFDAGDEEGKKEITAITEKLEYILQEQGIQNTIFLS